MNTGEFNSLYLQFESKRKTLEERNQRISDKLKNLGLKKNDNFKILSHHNTLSFEETTHLIASQIFQAWFKDFNPIFFPNLKQKNDKEVKLWFPEGRETSELGEIPKGWEVKKIKDIFDVTIGRTPPRKEFQWFTDDHKTGVPWVSIADMKNTNVYQKNSSEFLTSEAVKKFNVPLVKKGTTILSFKLTVGRVAIAGMPLTTNEAIAHFDPRGNFELSSFIYYFFRNYPFESMGSTSSIGTAINSTLLKDMKIILPPQELITIYDQTIKSILDRAYVK